MKSNNLGASVVVFGLSWGMAMGCGSSDDGPKSSGDAGSQDASNALPTRRCGSVSCEGLKLPVDGLPPLQPCCPEGDAEDACGLDTSVLSVLGVPIERQCEPRSQPGERDPSCPASPANALPDTGLSVSFEGCCRPDGRCGFLVDRVLGVLNLGLGCVDSTPFLGGGEAPRCGADAGVGGASTGGSSAGGASTGGSSASGGGGAAAGAGGAFGEP